MISINITLQFTVDSKSRKTATTKIELKMSMLMASYLNL